MPFWNKKKKKADDEEIKTPDDIGEDEEMNPADMSDDEFDEYINRARSGSIDDDEPEEDDANADPDEEADDVPEIDVGDIAAEEEPESDTEPESEPPYKSFGSEDEYNADIAKAVSAARKQWDLDNEARFARLERMERIASAYYPDNDDGFDRLGNDLETELAQRDGISVEEMHKRREREDKAAKWDEQENAKKTAADKRQAIIDAWVKEAGQLMVLFPDFSLEEALKNKDFADALTTGSDVFAAYAKAYQNNPDPEPEPEPEPEKREPIPQNGQTKQLSGGGAKRNPAELNSKDFKDYINKIKNK